MHNPKPEDTQEGDILFKQEIGEGDAGHVAIRVQGGENGLVSENSVYHWDGEDGRGTRDIIKFFNCDGGVQLLVRLNN